MFNAIIFDCDGTIADSMPPHYRAWTAILSRHGIEFDEDLFYGMGGWPSVKVAQHLIDRDGVDADAEQIAHDKEVLFEDYLHTVEPIIPVVDIINEEHGRVPLAVATGGIHRICTGILKHLGLLEKFETIVTAEDVEHAKPAPDIYLEAARRLGVDPNLCRAYEDTDPGIQAAQAAGMDVIDVRTFYTPPRVSEIRS